MLNKMWAGEWFTCLHVLPASEEMNIPVLEKESSGPMLPERENTTVTYYSPCICWRYIGGWDLILSQFITIKQKMIIAGKKKKTMKKRYVLLCISTTKANYWISITHLISNLLKKKRMEIASIGSGLNYFILYCHCTKANCVFKKY